MQKDGTAGGPMLQVNPQGSGYVWILFAAFFWSLLGVASKFCIAGGVFPLETAFWRAAIGCLCFIIHAIITGSWRVNVRDALIFIDKFLDNCQRVNNCAVTHEFEVAEINTAIDVRLVNISQIFHAQIMQG